MEVMYDRHAHNLFMCGSEDDDSSSGESFTKEQLLEAQVRLLHFCSCVTR